MRVDSSFIASFALLALVLVGGCASEQKKVEKELAAPDQANCATAAGDIRVLRSEKASVVARIAEGATAIYPASAVLGILSGVEGTKIKVAAGDYDKAIDGRIALIKQKCGEVETESP